MRSTPRSPSTDAATTDGSPRASSESSPGAGFVDALARKDTAALATVLAPDVDFQGMTPRRFWEGGTAEEVIAVLLEHWFAPDDQITAVLATATDVVERRHRITYRFAVTNGDGRHVVEQTAYYDADDGRIGFLRIGCSGFVPVSGDG